MRLLAVTNELGVGSFPKVATSLNVLYICLFESNVWIRQNAIMLAAVALVASKCCSRHLAGASNEQLYPHDHRVNGLIIALCFNLNLCLLTLQPQAL